MAATSSTGRMLVLITCWWVLMLTCCSPALVGASALPTASRRAFTKPQMIRAELLHRSHPDWPLSQRRGSTASDADHDDAHGTAHIARRLAGVEFTTPLLSGLAKYNSFEYAITLYLGTPPKKFVLIMDTGSDLLWVQCRPCTRPHKCYKQLEPYFNPSASASYSAIPCSNKAICNQTILDYIYPPACDNVGKCQILYEYADGDTVGGVLATETIAFSKKTDDELRISQYVFGCMNNNTVNTNAFVSTFDGVAGFARGPLSMTSQLSRITDFDALSYCIVPHRASANLTSPLMFGAPNSHGLQLVYTPYLKDLPLLYWVNMTGIRINGSPVSIPTAALERNATTAANGTIFDSGNYVSLVLTQAIYTPVIEMLLKNFTYPVINSSSGLMCFNMSGVQKSQYPSMSLQFAGSNDSKIVDFPLAAENLFLGPYTNDYKLSDVGTIQCLAITTVPNFTVNVIGNVAQANHVMVFDRVNARIGWASRDCALPM